MIFDKINFNSILENLEANNFEYPFFRSKLADNFKYDSKSI